ncbi:MAG: serine hydrolase, partial [Planctomycetales bacterium]|nr:serine hydrolase [Planctomycetales bacterium]
ARSSAWRRPGAVAGDDDVTTSYGLGFMVNRSMFGHGGAYSTQSTADRESGLILIWLVQHASFPGEGAQAQTEFRRTAQGLFTPK